MVTLVEKMLPAQFLIKHAIYMQSCAHLELAIWGIVTHLRPDLRFQEGTLEKSLETRARTGDLLKELKASIPLAPYYLIPALHNLSARVRSGVQNRNLAAHGAFFHADIHGKISVEHYWRDHASRAWMHVAEPLSMRDVQAAIDDVDALLNEAIRIRGILAPRQDLTFRLRFSSSISALALRDCSVIRAPDKSAQGSQVSSKKSGPEPARSRP
ncbi:hypothetical protein [Paracoccus sp. SJTW-4]|uniref:hypothetical protein n=1 Tax=Paracoccus sp. SJTW-4 TaxID=3078428 RepID=UPI0039E9C8A4